jgi:aldose 1-epimerase
MMTYGATVISIELPDRDGQVKNCVLAYDTLAEYEAGESYFGATVGRVAGIISGSKFSLDGDDYTLTANYEGHHLHGGTRGFAHYVWQAEPWERADAVGVTLRMTSPDGDQGYPGTVNVECTYTLTADGALNIAYTATTDRTTHVNMTHHSYFNLAGHDSGDVLDQELTIPSDQTVAIDDKLIPSGQFEQVEGTPLDFRSAKKIGLEIKNAPLMYDHSYLVRGGGGEVTLVASGHDPKSGRTLEVLTDQPVIHLYTTCHLKDERGAEGAAYQSEQAFCFEAQHLGDSPNRPEFPSTKLRPGETYKSSTTYRFLVQ